MDREKLKPLLGHWIVRFIMRPLLIAYILLFLFALCFSDTLIFPISNNGRPHYQDTEDYLKLTTADGKKISARYLPNPAATYTLLYSHGNGEDLGDLAGYLETLRDQGGFAVFAYDYHGYGTSQGTATEENTYRDIDAAYAYLTKDLHVPPNHIIIYGHSLGGGPSVDLASRKSSAGLIIESTFVSAYRVIIRYPIVPFDKFRSLNKIDRVRCPVLVIHGRADRTIPFSQGVTLYRAAHEPKRYLWINGGGHNNLPTIAGKELQKALREFTALLDGNLKKSTTPQTGRQR